MAAWRAAARCGVAIKKRASCSSGVSAKTTAQRSMARQRSVARGEIGEMAAAAAA